MPRVSVIIPAYNRAGFVAEAIRSVQAQTHQDVEIIVVDDASTDNTCDVVAALSDGDPRITFLRQPENRRVNAARNLGMRHASGEYVNFLDSDDLLAPDKLEKQLAEFERDPDLDMVICQSLIFQDTVEDARYVWHNLDPALTDHKALLAAFLNNDAGWGVLAPLWKRAFLDRLGPLPEHLFASDEAELFVRALCSAPRIKILPEALAYVRVHDQPSGRTEYEQPFKLNARLLARQYMWRAVHTAGLDTPANRRSLSKAFVGDMRRLVRARMAVSALKAWGYAWWLVPDLASRVQLGLLLPLLVYVLLIGRGDHLLKRVVRKFDLSRRPGKRDKILYTGGT
jgi:glycosyltransferase involved in cell wall biosynthesis